MATIYKQNGNENEKIEAAIAKAVELRAIHAALMQQQQQGNNSPSILHYSVSSPVSRRTPSFSAQDYPVFTPSYEDEPLPRSQQIILENRNAESWRDYNLNDGNVDDTYLSDYRTFTASSRNGLPSELINLGWDSSHAEDQYSVAGSYARNISPSPRPDYSKSRRNSLGDIRSLSSCNKYSPAVITSESDGLSKNNRKSNIVVPMTDSHTSLHSQPRNKGMRFSWLFPRLKRKNKNENSQTCPNLDERSQVLKNMELVSIETLKKKLMEAIESRNAALIEASEMKSSLGELRQKLEYLETYCEELKKALRQTVKEKRSQPAEICPKRGKLIDGNSDNLMHVNEKEMVEGFLQIVSESRVSVKQFCKILLGQIGETDHALMDKLNLLLQPYKLSLNSKRSKPVLYHLEAIINQSLYQDFENCVFQKNGTPNLLDPQQDRHTRFQSFVALRNLSWSEVLSKGTKYYSEEFSKFCDQKMGGIIATLGWIRPWPEQLLQAFFVTAKCIWLLHLLAFSFDPPLSILRVDEDKPFEQQYMEDVFIDRQRSQCPSRAKIMVMPGFYVHDRVLKCKVLCKYRSVV